MAIPTALRQLFDAYFEIHAHNYDLSTVGDCGKYMEAVIPYAQAHGYAKVGFLKKTGTGTQYNGHAIDSFLYDEPVPPSNLLQSCDVIKDAETNHASAGWSLDTPRYQESDWLERPSPNGGEGNEHDGMVPYVSYDENGFQRLKRMLAHDYGRRPQNADFDVSVWAGRYFHNCYMGPSGIPLGEQGALERVKPELCNALGIPMDNYYGE